MSFERKLVNGAIGVKNLVKRSLGIRGTQYFTVDMSQRLKEQAEHAEKYVENLCLRGPIEIAKYLNKVKPNR